MTDMTDPFETPGSGGFIQWEDLWDKKAKRGELLVIIPSRYEEHVPTVNTKDGKKSPCVVADVYVLTDDVEEHETHEFPEQMIFQAMHHRLKGKMNKIVLARLGQGPKKQGQNAPWVLLPVDPGTEDHKLGMEWYAGYQTKNDPFTE